MKRMMERMSRNFMRQFYNKQGSLVKKTGALRVTTIRRAGGTDFPEN